MHNIWIIFRTTNYILLWMMFQWFILRFGATHHIRLCVCMQFSLAVCACFFSLFGCISSCLITWNSLQTPFAFEHCISVPRPFWISIPSILPKWKSLNNLQFYFSQCFETNCNIIEQFFIFLDYCQIDHFNHKIHKAFWKINFSFKKLENEKIAI